MLNYLLKKVFGSANERIIKGIMPVVESINGLEPKFENMTEQEIRAEVQRLKDYIAAAVADVKDDHDKLVKAEEKAMNEILPEAFALTREASKRVLGQRHYDVQLVGGIILHQGTIAEMKTGEGKTLTSTLPLVLNALTGRGAHLVTVNDYLAQRDAEWMGRVYRYLGLTVGTIYHGQSHAEKKTAYGADITYGTNNEYGFDYLRDNMKYSVARMVQRDLHYAIVDEVDSILIDEARTPLIISGPSEDSTGMYYEVDKAVRKLKAEEHYIVEEKDHNTSLTDEGVTEIERLLNIPNLYDPTYIEALHKVNQSLTAHTLYIRDKDYIVQDEDGQQKVIIVDEFTGRTMPGRRWSDGLHQAVEAKEGVTIESENQTLATITFQNFFRMFDRLSGMTGTADTEAVEFKSIYDLDVVVIPTNKPMIRKDQQDVVFKTTKAKYDAIGEEIIRLHKKGQPVLVGTISVEHSELLSKLLNKHKIAHNVLNAKQHEREADVIAQAGTKGAVTIATNMAGRGTDIILGGNAEFMAWNKVGRDAPYEDFRRVYEELNAQTKKDREEILGLGGLYVLGTERHESRRIDNQLRGRSGRQGDPGESRFFISLEDDLMRLFGGERLKSMMERLRIPDDVPIEHRLITSTIEKSQRKVESKNFDIRKNLLEYDDVMNQQRTTIYSMRREVLKGYDWHEDLREKMENIILTITEDVDPKLEAREWDWESINDKLKRWFNCKTVFSPETFEDDDNSLTKARLEELLYEYVDDVLTKKIDAASRAFNMTLLEQSREFLLQVPDGSTERWNWPAVANFVRRTFNINANVDHDRFPTKEHFKTYLTRLAEKVSGDHFGKQVRNLHMEILDKLWKEHLLAMDHLRDGIGLRGYGQRDPKHEYKREGFAMFEDMVWRITTELVEYMFKLEVRAPTVDEERAAEEKFRKLEEKMNLVHGQNAAAQAQKVKKATLRRVVGKVGRNDPCPCGSGQKFKKCHWGQPGYEQYM